MAQYINKDKLMKKIDKMKENNESETYNKVLDIIKMFIDKAETEEMECDDGK